MIVTEIVELSKSRCKVYIDDAFAFVLYKGELRLYHVMVGKEITTENYQEILETVLPKRAKLRALNLLQKRAYTEKQLKDKLQEGAYPKTIVEDALTYVKSFGYINDLQYALDYLNCYAERKARKKMEIDLFQKGISKEIVQEAFNRWEEEGTVQDEKAMILKLLEKKNYNNECELGQKRRIYSFLLRKGYSAEAIQDAMKL